MNVLAKRQKQIVDFGNSPEFKALSAFYSRSSFFSALGISRQEDTHNNFIAWLLTPKNDRNDHGLGDTPLRKLLETLALVCGSLPHSSGKIAPNVSAAIITGNYTLSNISVEREKHISVGRLDIYLEGNIAFDGAEYPLRLVIENKVKSTEHDSQTERYQDALKRSVSRPEIFLSVFLTPLNSREYELLREPGCASKDFVQLNYEYLAEYVIEPCRDLLPDGPIKTYLDEYLLALGLPELRQNKGDIIMAISKEERELLSRFWERHKELLTAAIITIGDHVQLDDDENEIISHASKTLQTVVQRDLTRYEWKYLPSGGGRIYQKTA